MTKVSTNSLSQLMSLDLPKVALDRVNGSTSSLSSPLPPTQMTMDSRTDIYNETGGTQDDGSGCFICSYTTHATTSNEKNRTVSFAPDQRCHLAFWETSIGTKDDDDLYVFCSVCLATVERLLRLEKEVEELQARILAVLKLKLRPSHVVGSDDDELEIMSGDTNTHTTDLQDPLLLGSLKLEDEVCQDDEGRQLIVSDHDIDGPCLSVDEDRASPKTSKKKKNKPITGPHQCDLCGKVYKRSPDLLFHVKSEHTSKRVEIPIPAATGQGGRADPYTCTECGRRFVSRWRLKVHMTRIHLLNPSKKEVCPDCSQTFYSSEIFNAHTHPDKNDLSRVCFKCQVCDSVFVSKKSFQKHRDRIHGPHRHRQVSQCRTCGKTFRSSGGQRDKILQRLLQHVALRYQHNVQDRR